MGTNLVTFVHPKTGKKAEGHVIRDGVVEGTIIVRIKKEGEKVNELTLNRKKDKVKAKKVKADK